MVSLNDATNPLDVPENTKCSYIDCTRRPIIKARLYEGNEWLVVYMCVWHRMARAMINNFLFDSNGNLLPQYVPTMIDGLLCYKEITNES